LFSAIRRMKEPIRPSISLGSIIPFPFSSTRRRKSVGPCATAHDTLPTTANQTPANSTFRLYADCMVIILPWLGNACCPIF
jgi:hypothetical protein